MLLVGLLLLRKGILLLPLLLLLLLPLLLLQLLIPLVLVVLKPEHPACVRAFPLLRQAQLELL
jgi:hypothetical protein